jgi:hypothetical protein
MLIQSVLFTEEECQTIIGFRRTYPLIGDNGRNDVFVDFQYKFYHLRNISDIDWILDRLCHFFEDQTGLKIYHRPQKLNLHHFMEGDRFAKHIDRNFPVKEWNIGIVLNQDFEGGDYILYDEENNPLHIQKKTGNVCIYRSATPHEVTPVVRGERWTIALFLSSLNTVKSTNLI